MMTSGTRPCEARVSLRVRLPGCSQINLRVPRSPNPLRRIRTWGKGNAPAFFRPFRETHAHMALQRGRSVIFATLPASVCPTRDLVLRRSTSSHTIPLFPVGLPSYTRPSFASHGALALHNRAVK
ncbi:hypothetical protein BD310DRAFT_537333 [Dichomitus squalens]|uniref:Uncharacterized protein n=1 Tax=Dichomitus squalens TaxID=114155 RepID=A0A4Q9PT97_9APHY|nr:hypothetical protein BD310DRAFT_537333 [Dichomitus squalens]